MKKSVMWFILLSIFCMNVLAAQAAEPVKIAVDNGNPPFMYAKDDKAAGLYPVVLEAIFAKMGVPTEISALPWKRTLALGEKGEVAIGGIYKNEERVKIYDYSAPIYSEKLVLYVEKDKSFPFSGIQDLKGKKIGTILGWSYGEAFDNARKDNLFTVDEVVSDSVNFKKLASGRVDCVIAIEMAGKKAVAEEKLEDKVIALPTPVAINDTFLVFAKSVNKGELLGQFNATLAKMKEDGSYDKLIADFEKSN